MSMAVVGVTDMVYDNIGFLAYDAADNDPIN